MKKFGFTLAEVLVTLSIIGVISALTLPQLTSSHTEKTLETQTKKFYGSLVNAIDNYCALNGVDLIQDADGYTMDGFVRSSFKVSRGSRANFADQYKSIDKSTSFDKSQKIPDVNTIYTTQDGMVIYISGPNDDNGTTMNFVVDVNGRQGPNTIGRDLWFIGIDENSNDIVDGKDWS